MKTLFYSLFTFCFAVLLFSCNENSDSKSYAYDELESIEEELSASNNMTHQWKSGDGEFVVTAADACVSGTVSTYTPTDQNGNSSRVKETPAYERKLIKNADLKFKTDSIERTHELLSDAAKNLGGFISAENQSNQVYRNTSTMTIRIPSVNFDQLVAICDGQGKGNFDRRNISASDVTEEFLDVSARVKTKKELESRYHELLKKAKNVEEVIQVEKEIGKLRTEIESAEGRLKYLSDRVSLSTVSVEFYKEIIKVKPVDNRPNRFIGAFVSGWKGLVSFMVGLLNIWPFLIVMIGLGIFVVRKARKFRSSKK